MKVGGFWYNYVFLTIAILVKSVLELSEEVCDIILSKGNQEILAFKVQKRKKNVHCTKFKKEKSRGII